MAYKCYKMIEREHRKLGSKYLKERVELTEAVIQIETLMEEEDKSHTDSRIIFMLNDKVESRKRESLTRILKLVDLNEKIVLSDSWVKHFQKEFSEAGLFQLSS